MIANTANSSAAAVPHPFTLNDLRIHPSMEEEPTSTSALSLSGLVLAVVLAIGAFIWLDPLRLFTPTEASPPAPAFVPSAQPAQPTYRQEIIAPLTPVPATKFVEAPVPATKSVEAPIAPAPVVRPRAATVKPESRAKPTAKPNATVLPPSPMEKSAPSALVTPSEERTAPSVPLTKPEEKTDAPISLKPADDTKDVPKPAAANDRAPATE